MISVALVPIGALCIVEVKHTVTLVLWPLAVFGEGAVWKQILSKSLGVFRSPTEMFLRDRIFFLPSLIASSDDDDDEPPSECTAL